MKERFWNGLILYWSGNVLLSRFIEEWGIYDFVCYFFGKLGKLILFFVFIVWLGFVCRFGVLCVIVVECF